MPVIETIDRILVTREVVSLAPLLACTPVDPFGLDDPCPLNPAGHRFTSSCGDVACVYCAKVVWS